jgi:hypothetical protein
VSHGRGPCPYREELEALARSLGEWFGGSERFEHVDVTACLVSTRCGCVATIAETPERAIEAAHHLQVTAELAKASPHSDSFPRNAGGTGGAV